MPLSHSLEPWSLRGNNLLDKLGTPIATFLDYRDAEYVLKALETSPDEVEELKLEVERLEEELSLAEKEIKTLDATVETLSKTQPN